MAGKRHDEGRLCPCDRRDGTCAGLAVRRLTPGRVQELAEEIWAASLGDLIPARALPPDPPDPRSSRAGASAQAAYRRRRVQERESWRLDWVRWSLAVIGAAAAGAIVVGAAIGDWLVGPVALLLAVWTGWRLRFRPSPEVRVWRRQATTQRQTGGLLAPLEEEGYLVLHDVTLPGWLDSIEHLVVGPTGVWVVESWKRRQATALREPDAGGEPAGTLCRGLYWKTEAIAELLDRDPRIPVRRLLCVRRGLASSRRSIQDVRMAAPRQLAYVVRHEPPVASAELQRATARLLEVLRPAI